MSSLRLFSTLALPILLVNSPAAEGAQEAVASRILQIEERLIVFAAPPRGVTESAEMPRSGVLSIMEGAGLLKLRGEDLRISFPEGGFVVIEDWSDRANHVRLPSGATLTVHAVEKALRSRSEGLDITGLAEFATVTDRPSDDEIVPTRAPLAGRAEWLAAREILEPNETEPTGFRVYGYLLFADNMPDGEDFERRLAAIRAYVYQFKQVDAHRPDETALFASFVDESWHRRDQDPDAPETVIRALMRAYDFERARIFQRRLGLPTRGPVIVSGNEPLLGNDNVTLDDVMVMDFSWVEPGLVDEWLREYRRIAEGEYEWESGSLRRFALEVRSRLETLGRAVGVTRAAVESIVSLPSG